MAERQLVSVKAVDGAIERTDEVFAWRGAIALLVIALLQVGIGLLLPAANRVYALASGTNENLFVPPWWIFAAMPIALGVLLLLTHAPSRHYLKMHGKIRLLNSPFVIASFALFWAVVSVWGTGSYSDPRWLYLTAAVIALGVTIAGAIIDVRQDGVIPFIVGGFKLSFGRKNRENRIRSEHQAAEAYARIPNAARLPVFTMSGRWAIAPVVTLIITVVLAAARVVTPLYVVLGLIGTVTTGLFLVVILHNLYARKTGIYLDLPSPYVSSYHYLPDDVRKTYHLRWSGQGVAFLSGFGELAAFALCAVAWLGAVFLWTPIF